VIMGIFNKTQKFREALEGLSREDLFEIIKDQDPELIKQINRIEWVFENKLNHISWSDGTPVIERKLTNRELALLVDEPFEMDLDLLAAGVSAEHQRQLHISKDPVVWAKQFLGAELRVYQILILRDPGLRKVLRAGRRLGKTFSLAIMLLHYSYTHKDGRSLVIAPMKTQVELIYQEILRIASKNEVVTNSITRKVTSPQFMIQFSNGSTIRFFTSGMKSGGKCLTPDHEVLTTNGWKNVNQINVGEEILSWKDGQYFWDTVNNFWEYDYDNNLVVHDGKQISFSVTNNHKFAAKTRAPGSKWKDVQADNLKDYYIPTGSISPVAPSTNIFSKEELEIWGWWLSEGSGYIGKMSRISQTKIYGRERVCQLANTLNIHYTTPKKEIRIKWKPPIFSGINAYDKFIPRELMTENNLQGLLDGLLSGDGWIRRDGWEYSSSSYQLACDVQEIAVRLGLRANIREKNILYTPVKGGKPNRHWVVSAYPKTESILSKDNLKKIHYKGKVYCVTVPNTGYFLTRHNGLVHVTGNSDVARGQEAHLIVLDEMDYMHADDLDALYAMLQKTAEDQPDKVMIGASTPTGRRERFWEWCRSPRFTEFWFPSYCFDPKTLITMADGSFKYINEINIGDRVLTEKGPKKVTRTFERQFDGEIFNVKTYGSNCDLLVTGEHPFLAAKRIRRQSKYDWDWTDVSQLQIPSRRNTSSGHVIKSIIDIEEIDKKIDLLKYFNEELIEIDDNRVQLKKIHKGGRKFINSLPRYIDLDNNLATLLGWYTAEGHLESKDEVNGYKTIGWTLSKKENIEIETIEKALDYLSAGKLNLTYRKDNDSVCLRLNNGPLALLFNLLVGRGSTIKELHPIIMKSPKEFQNTFLQSYGQGDGYFSKSNSIVFRTSSKLLAKQIQIMCTRVNNNYPSISRSKQPIRAINKKYREYVVSDTYAIEWQLNQDKINIGKKYLDNGEYALLLKSKDLVQYSGLVYNFEVEDTNSYIANGLLVHNCNPYFSKEQEEEFREQYSPSGYRHEIEADWGEDSEGVYPRKFVDRAFISPSWDYTPEITSARSFHTIGVDWDKYGAGTNIVIVETCAENYEDTRFRGKSRICYREEIPRSEYTLTKAVDRIIELNRAFNPKHIYVDRGYGEVQVELLKKYGVENPYSGLRDKVKGISFGESIDVRDPYTKLMIKKEMKPFMVDNLRQFLEKERILIPESDEEIYMQLISYVVIRTTQTGRPVFEAAGSAMDHAHDALMLALLAITQNYGEFSQGNYATRTESFSNEFFMPKQNNSDSEDDKPKFVISGRANALNSTGSFKRSTSSKKTRKMF
jgi:intein/homing endonuclease